MLEHVAIVGSRRGANLEHVRSFVRALHAKQPDTILVSGGADGVDTLAEQTWLGLGGEVWSFRPTKISDGEYGIEKWILGVERPMKYALRDEPTWANFASAATYRDMLIAEASDRVVAFMRRGGSRGTSQTILFARNEKRDVHVYEVEAVTV